MRRPHESRAVLRDVIAAAMPALYVGMENGVVNQDPAVLDALNDKGVAIVVGRIENGTTQGTKVRAAVVEWTVPVVVMEKTAQNDTEDGFGQSADEVADTLVNAILSHASLGPHILALANDFWTGVTPDKGLEGVVLRFVLKGQYTPT